MGVEIIFKFFILVSHSEVKYDYVIDSWTQIISGPSYCPLAKNTNTYITYTLIILPHRLHIYVVGVLSLLLLFYTIEFILTGLFLRVLAKTDKNGYRNPLGRFIGKMQELEQNASLVI